MGVEDYTLGRGEVHFSRYKSGTMIGEGYRYLGNSPSASFSGSAETLEHFNKDRGLGYKDASISYNVGYAGSLTVDEIAMENLALFLFAPQGAETITEAGGAQTYTITDAIPGRTYQLGESDSNPSGDMLIQLTGLTVVDDVPTTYDAMDDYIVDYQRGLITIVEGGAIAAGETLTVSYTTLASTRDQVVDGSTRVEGWLKYIEYNATGPNKVWTMPRVAFSPNGELNLKDDSWQEIPLNVEIMRKSGLSNSIFIDGVPVAS